MFLPNTAVYNTTAPPQVDGGAEAHAPGRLVRNVVIHFRGELLSAGDLRAQSVMKLGWREIYKPPLSMFATTRHTASSGASLVLPPSREQTRLLTTFSKTGRGKAPHTTPSLYFQSDCWCTL